MENKFLGITPPLGWNSWNTFTWEINDKLIREAADAFVSEGLKDVGYEYVVIDDCWSEKQRDKNGKLVPDHWKFPDGIKPVADYVHSKGLKFGMYSCAGTHTCGGHPGSFEHEFDDAETFAEWGVDYLKYDYCYKPDHIPGEVLYKRMSMALRNCGRDIMFSACNWGNDNVYKWIRESGAHLFRSTGDIQDNWESIKRLALSQIGSECYGGNFCHNDIDMLVVGMHGGSNNEWINSTEQGVNVIADSGETMPKLHRRGVPHTLQPVGYHEFSADDRLRYPPHDPCNQGDTHKQGRHRHQSGHRVPRSVLHKAVEQPGQRILPR